MENFMSSIFFFLLLSFSPCPKTPENSVFGCLYYIEIIFEGFFVNLAKILGRYSSYKEIFLWMMFQAFSFLFYCSLDSDASVGMLQRSFYRDFFQINHIFPVE